MHIQDRYTYRTGKHLGHIYIQDRYSSRIGTYLGQVHFQKMYSSKIGTHLGHKHIQATYTYRKCTHLGQVYTFRTHTHIGQVLIIQILWTLYNSRLITNLIYKTIFIYVLFVFFRALQILPDTPRYFWTPLGYSQILPDTLDTPGYSQILWILLNTPRYSGHSTIPG